MNRSLIIILLVTIYGCGGSNKIEPPVVVVEPPVVVVEPPVVVVEPPVVVVHLPVADAGVDLTGVTGFEIPLDGSKSISNKPLTYSWTLVASPRGSVTSLTDADTDSPSLIFDTKGSYYICLNVSDGVLSDVDYMKVTTDNAETLQYHKIQQLMINSIIGENENVEYIVTGDSTRDNNYNDMLPYYRTQLNKANILVFNNAASGQSGQNWKNNINKATLEQAIAVTDGDGSNTILEFSHGINDYKNGATKEETKMWIKTGLESYLLSKPKANILLVTPITTGYEERNTVLKEIYDELSLELSLPLVNGLIPTENVHGNSDYYHDATHPNKFGSFRIVNYILSEVGDSLFHNTVTLVEMPDNSTPPHQMEMSGVVGIGYWNTLTGTATYNEEWRRISTIPVIPNFTLKIQHQGNRFDVKFLDEDSEFIVSKSSIASSSEVYRTIVIPENSWYANINISSEGDMYDRLGDTPSVKYLIDDSKILTIEEINEGLDIQLRIE